MPHRPVPPLKLKSGRCAWGLASFVSGFPVPKLFILAATISAALIGNPLAPAQANTESLNPSLPWDATPTDDQAVTLGVEYKFALAFPDSHEEEALDNGGDDTKVVKIDGRDYKASETFIELIHKKLAREIHEITERETFVVKKVAMKSGPIRYIEVAVDATRFADPNEPVRLRSDGTIPDERKWDSYIVKESNSEAKEKGKLFVPVEINTPKFLFGDKKAKDDLYKIIEKFKDLYGDRMVADHSGAVHVHAGRQDSKLFTLPTLQRLAVLQWVTEPVKRLIRDPASPNFDHKYIYGYPAQENSNLATEMYQKAWPLKWKELPVKDLETRLPLIKDLWKEYQGRKGDHDVKDDFGTLFLGGTIWAITRILETRDSKELGHLMSGEEKAYHRLGNNWSVVTDKDWRVDIGPKTIESRILEGTLDLTLVRGWIQAHGKEAELAISPEKWKKAMEVVIPELADKVTVQDPEEAMRWMLVNVFGLDKLHATPIVGEVARISKERGSHKLNGANFYPPELEITPPEQRWGETAQSMRGFKIPPPF